jgi:hypothetical protein
MDNLLAAAGPIASSSSNGGKKRRRSTNEHKTVVKGKDGERVDPVLHSIGGQVSICTAVVSSSPSMGQSRRVEHELTELLPPPPPLFCRPWFLSLCRRVTSFQG